MSFLERHRPISCSDVVDDVSRTTFDQAIEESERIIAELRAIKQTAIKTTFQTPTRLAEARHIAWQRRDHLLPDP